MHKELQFCFTKYGCLVAQYVNFKHISCFSASALNYNSTYKLIINIINYYFYNQQYRTFGNVIMFYESKQGPEVQHLMFITNITTNETFYNIS